MSSKAVIGQINSTFQRFVRLEAASGIVLMLCAVVAIVWANSPWAARYFELWDLRLSVSFSNFELSKPLLLWINDGLMAIFFFLVGLEIKREVMAGELRSLRKAMLPMVAAIGGMLVPAAVFVVINAGHPGGSGWGIPMATDIAFSLGILLLLGKRVPLSLKIFLTALAIVDDIGAVLIIAVFYSGQVDLNALLAAGGVLAVLVVLNFARVKTLIWYLIGGIVIWYFFLKSGIHPTVAGVLVALTIPANRRMRTDDFVARINRVLPVVGTDDPDGDARFLTYKQLNALDEIEIGAEQVLPPLQKLEHRLHGIVAFGIMPVFALANAGVAIGGGDSEVLGWLTLSVALGLIVGKSVGVVLFSWIGVRLGLCDLPANVNWIQILAIGLLAGVGFTMALFIANLALDSITLLNQAKVGILVGSLIAGSAGYLLLRASLPKNNNTI